jgi:hypothetical protein
MKGIHAVGVMKKRNAGGQLRRAGLLSALGRRLRPSVTGVGDDAGKTRGAAPAPVDGAVSPATDDGSGTVPAAAGGAVPGLPAQGSCRPNAAGHVEPNAAGERWAERCRAERCKAERCKAERCRDWCLGVREPRGAR